MKGGGDWINEGRLVTDGTTSVDGCFNFILPLYILSMLFIRQKYRNSSAPLLKALITFFFFSLSFSGCVALLSFLLGSHRVRLSPHVASRPVSS